MLPCTKRLRRNNSTVLLKLLSGFSSRTYRLAQPLTCYCTSNAFRQFMILQMALSGDCLNGVSECRTGGAIPFLKGLDLFQKTSRGRRNGDFLCNTDCLLDGKHKAVFAMCSSALCSCSHVLIQCCLVCIFFCIYLLTLPAY